MSTAVHADVERRRSMVGSPILRLHRTARSSVLFRYDATVLKRLTRSSHDIVTVLRNLKFWCSRRLLFSPASTPRCWCSLCQQFATPVTARDIHVRRWLWHHLGLSAISGRRIICTYIEWQRYQPPVTSPCAPCALVNFFRILERLVSTTLRSTSSGNLRQMMLHRAQL